MDFVERLTYGFLIWFTLVLVAFILWTTFPWGLLLFPFVLLCYLTGKVVG